MLKSDLETEINNNSVLYTLHEQITKNSSRAVLMLNCRPVTTTFLIWNITDRYVLNVARCLNDRMLPYTGFFDRNIIFKLLIFRPKN